MGDTQGSHPTSALEGKLFALPNFFFLLSTMLHFLSVVLDLGVVQVQQALARSRSVR